MGVISRPESEVSQLRPSLRQDYVDAVGQDAPEKPHFHRLRETRMRKQLSVGQMAMLLRVSPSQIWMEEDPSADVTLSVVKKWADALEVPINELLVEQNSNMQLIGMSSSQLSRIASMATVMSDDCDDSATANMIIRLISQLEQLEDSRR